MRIHFYKLHLGGNSFILIDSESEKDFDELVKTAKLEGYYDNIKTQFDLLEFRRICWFRNVSCFIY